jgi:DNA (cytosine-5)-methyltransferase 1
MKQKSIFGKKRKSWQKIENNFTFIDLFAGIGGFRIAAEKLGGKCVFSSEWDKNSQKTYITNFSDTPFGDITKIKENTVPMHDILFGGFPCQAFSISGKKQGFNDTRGTLFFDIARILKEKKPSMFLLENVKNFATHDNGRTLSLIIKTLEDLGYTVFHKVLRSSDYGVPQARERIYIVGFKKDYNVKIFDYPNILPEDKTVLVRHILEKETPTDAKIINKDIIHINSKNSFDLRKPRKVGYFNKGGQGERIYSIDSAGITLSAYGGGAASKTGAYLVNGIVRKLSPRECARMQGFPEDFEIPVSTNMALKQFGDSVSIPVLEQVLTKMIKVYKDHSI